MKTVRVWAAGLAMAFALCAGYLGIYAFRAAWKSHYPALVGQWANDGRTALIGWFGTELAYEELGYADRVNDAAHHALFAGDPYIKENHSRRLVIINWGFNAALGAVQAVTGDINKTWLITRFACCLGWFVLLYFLSLRVVEEPPLALFCAAFLTGYSYLLTLLFAHNLVWSGGLFKMLAHNAWTMILYGRTEGVLRLPRAGFTYVFLFLACWALIKAAETEDWGWVAASAVAGGFLAYAHLDVWSAYLAAAGFTAVIIWFKKRSALVKIAVSLIGSTLLSLPFFLSNFPPNRELALRAMFGAGLPPSVSGFSFVYLPAAWLMLRRKGRPIHWFLAAMALSSFVMMNAGYIVGFRFDPYRWAYIGNIFLFLILVSYIPRKTARAGFWRPAAALLAFVAFLQGIGYAAIHYPFQGLPKDYDAALSWLDQNTGKDSVVLSVNPEINALVPAYTRDKVELAFIPPVFSDYPLLDNYERFLGGLKVLDINEKRFTADTLLKPSPYYNERSEIVDTGFKRGEIEKSQLSTYLFYITPKWLVQKTISEAEGHPAALSPDYVWFGTLEKQYAGKAWPGRWKPVYRNPSVTIYAR